MISLGLFPLDIVGPQFHDQQDLRARNEQSSLSPLSFVSLGLSCTTVLLYELLDSETKVQRVRSYGLYILHYVRPFCRRCPLRVFELFSLDFALQYHCTSGRMQVDCASWIRWCTRGGPRAFTRRDTRRPRVQLVLKRAEERSTIAMRYFPDPKLLVQTTK